MPARIQRLNLLADRLLASPGDLAQSYWKVANLDANEAAAEIAAYQLAVLLEENKEAVEAIRAFGFCIVQCGINRLQRELPTVIQELVFRLCVVVKRRRRSAEFSPDIVQRGIVEPESCENSACAAQYLLTLTVETLCPCFRAH